MSSPTQVANLASVIQLSVFEEACALKSNGSVWCWSLVVPVTPPTDVSAGMKFKQIVVTQDPACRYAGVASTDKVYCWDGAKWARHFARDFLDVRAQDGRHRVVRRQRRSLGGNNLTGELGGALRMRQTNRYTDS